MKSSVLIFYCVFGSITPLFIGGGLISFADPALGTDMALSANLTYSKA